MFREGKSGNPRGRPKGSHNKFVKIREDWLKAYQKGGGVKLFSRLIKEDLVAFMKLGTMLMPKDVNLDVDGRITVSWLNEDDKNPV